MLEVGDSGDRLGKGSGEIILLHVEDGETPAGGEVEAGGRVEAVGCEGEGGEGRETAENGRKRPSELEISEIDRDDLAGIFVAGDSGPVARRVIAVVPGGERVGGVVEGLPESLKIETFLVQTEREVKRI